MFLLVEKFTDLVAGGGKETLKNEDTISLHTMTVKS